MNNKLARDFVDNCAEVGPQSALERLFIGQFLKEKGYTLIDLQKLPPDEAKHLMREACTYASLKLAEIESKNLFLDEIGSST
jgi:hypothetical protein